MIDKEILKEEDFVIQVTPLLTPDNTWDSNVRINIATSSKNPLNEKDTSDLWHLCRMMCSVIPLMQEDSDLMYVLDEYARNTKDINEDKSKDTLTIESKQGNVIKLNFNSGGDA
tara:strand:- start:759 stop:1100 length:342 start_codon:yes stop_codon:yes gene_type:complete